MKRNITCFIRLVNSKLLICLKDCSVGTFSMYNYALELHDFKSEFLIDPKRINQKIH